MTIRQRRLLFTVCGLVLAACGGIFWLVGDENSVTGDNRMDIHSSAAWGKVLGYQSTDEKDYDDAKILKEKGESQKTIGITLAVVGLAVFSTRFTIRSSAKEV